MQIKNLSHLYLYCKETHRWNLPEPILILLLFVPTKDELPLTELERLGIWAARRAREEVKKNMTRKTDSK
jgi:hypothetical protein